MNEKDDRRKMALIEIKGLTRKFNDFTAVDHISFKIMEGEIFGFLGPNGAGKTTTISMVATILDPTSGTASVEGHDIKDDRSEVRKRIGIVFQDPSLDDELTAYENLVFHAVMYDLGGEVMEKRIAELLKLVELEARKNDLVKTFSGGMKRRLEIARGLLHHPKILFLDEPTIGLDPQTRNHIWEYIEKLNKKERITIILTTHYMDEAEKLANRIAIIDHGKVIAIDTPDRLKESLEGDVVTLKSRDSKRIADALKGMKGCCKVKTHDGTVEIGLKNAEERLPHLLKKLDKFDISSISLHKPNLEDVFLHLTGKTIREEEGSAKDSMRLRRRVWHR